LLSETLVERYFFGFRSLAIREKSFVILFEDSLVVKLDEDKASKALSLKHTTRWNPYGREKKKWILFPFELSVHWNEFIDLAAEIILNETGGSA